MFKLLTSQHKIRTRFQTRPALPTYPPELRPADDSRQDDSEDEVDGDGDVQEEGDSFESDDSESSEAECSDSDSSYFSMSHCFISYDVVIMGSMNA